VKSWIAYDKNQTKSISSKWFYWRTNWITTNPFFLLWACCYCFLCSILAFKCHSLINSFSINFEQATITKLDVKQHFLFTINKAIRRVTNHCYSFLNSTFMLIYTELLTWIKRYDRYCWNNFYLSSIPISLLCLFSLGQLFFIEIQVICLVFVMSSITRLNELITNVCWRWRWEQQLKSDT
jgi:hypothetical protein